MSIQSNGQGTGGVSGGGVAQIGVGGQGLDLATSMPQFLQLIADHGLSQVGDYVSSLKIYILIVTYLLLF